MAYLIDRQQALYGPDIVVVVTGHRRGERSRVTLRDNSLYRTLSRPRALVRGAARYPEGIDARWWKPR